MARTWTPSQETAMNLRGKLILVSAAAGSGKTSVLTERIIRTLTDPEHPADLSRLLVVTFTRAAAAELKSRIAAALTDALAERPGDPHLSRQLFLLGSAQISTIDSFFQQAVRANFEQLGLPASFRLADASETDEFCPEILDGVIREFYERGEPGSQCEEGPFARLKGNRFADMMDHILSNRSDAELDRKLLDFTRKFSSFAEGTDLIKTCAEELRRSAEHDFFSSAAGKTVVRHLCDAYAFFAEELQDAEKYLAIDPDAAAYFSGVHASDSDFCCAMNDALTSGSYAKVREIIHTFHPKRFPTMKQKPPQMEHYKKIRDQLKKTTEEFRESLFLWSPEEVRSQMLRTAELFETLHEVFSLYHQRVFDEKKRRGILEFDDVRELLYRLLAQPDGSPSPFAESLSAQYDAVYIDEYQDVDFLQDKIFSIIGQNRRFMVGDIKQSIYGFRGSEPSIFAGYRKAMPLSTDPDAVLSDAVCVFMSENFRCDRPVIDYANRVCSFLFSACEQSVGYRPQDDLVCSKSADESNAHPPVPVQTLIFEPPAKTTGLPDTEKISRMHREAEWVAAEISALLREGRLDSGARIAPSDIAILVRNTAHGTEFANELKKLGIPVSAPGTEDLLHTPLMTDLLNLLRTVDNPYRDLSLSEYLLTEEGGFTLEELTVIRQSAPERSSLYDAMKIAAELPELPVSHKTAEWITWLEAWRKIASVQPADRFLRLLYHDPRLSKHAGKPELLYLYEQARIYQRSSWCGLYGFLEHFSRLLNGDAVSGGGFRKAESTIRIMTIHHSKGLEFPVVFLCACGNRFNTDPSQSPLLFHRNVGCASKLYSEDLQERGSTILVSAVKAETGEDETEESIRTLYVALTRARERMYVTGTPAGKPDSLMDSASLMRRGSRFSILNAGSYLHWIVGALSEAEKDLPRTSIAPVRIIPATEEISGIPLVSHMSSGEISSMPQDLPSETVAEYLRILERREKEEYPLDCLHGIPTKIAASKLRTDLLDTLTADGNEEAEDLALQTQIDLMCSATPAFETLLRDSRVPSAADIGTATHAFLEFCDLRRLPDCGIQSEIDRLVAENYLTPESASIIHRKQLEDFLAGDLMQRILLADHIYREQKFSLLFPLRALTRHPEKFSALHGQTIFVQGSIDLLLRMPDGKLILYDYKTDRITEEERKDPDLLRAHLLYRHGNQLACYAQAVRELFGTVPDEINVYSLPLGKSVRLPVDAGIFDYPEDP